MLFDDRHRFPALQAGAKRELCFYVRRRLEPAPSGGGEFRSPHFFMATFLNEYFLYQQADFLHPT
jgi:hypothetical protein